MTGAQQPSTRGLALAVGRARFTSFQTEDALADAVAERLRDYPHRVITAGVSDVRDGATEPTLFVYGADEPGNAMAAAGYVLGLGRDRPRLGELLERAELRRSAS